MAASTSVTRPIDLRITAEMGGHASTAGHGFLAIGQDEQHVGVKGPCNVLCLQRSNGTVALIHFANLQHAKRCPRLFRDRRCVCCAQPLRLQLKAQPVCA